MTPKEKALQLIDAFDEYAESRISDNGRGFNKKYCSKQCALIVVDEILKTTPPYCDRYEEYYIKLYENQKPEYWYQVKQEIENL
jgi:hypothetical protein